MVHQSIDPTDITAVILAGGRATRLGGVDKGLQDYQGRPLVAHAIERLAGQAGRLLINCNRNADRYAAFGHRLIADRLPDFPGPLAGLDAAFQAVATRWLLTVPCDTPAFPEDLAQRLHASLGGARASYACTPAPQPVFALYERDLGKTLEDFLAAEKRGVGQWLARIKAAPADFSDIPEAFMNLNCADDWPRSC